jgi:uncharacterized protein (DUF2384 family)
MTSLNPVPARRRDDVALIRLIDSYGVRGGLASPEGIVNLMRPYWRQPISILARWIIGRRVVSFSWRAQMLLPAFQFERPRMTPNPVVADCSLAFGESTDDEGFAAWFVRPCEWLDQRMPVDLLSMDPGAVIAAAASTRLAMK